MGGEEAVDKLPELTEACKPKCTAEWVKYEQCVARLAVKKEGDCEAWYFDHIKCLDKCRVPQLSKYWK